MIIGDKTLALLKLLPNGCQKELVKRTGITAPTIHRFARGKSISYNKAKVIIIQTMTLYKEIKEIEGELMKRIMQEGKS